LSAAIARLVAKCKNTPAGLMHRNAATVGHYSL